MASDVNSALPGPGLNENQIRRVVVTFGYIDSLLKSIEALTEPDASPFAKERPDLSPDEGRLLRSFVASMRSRMVAALDRMRIPRPTQNLSARWSVRTAMVAAEVELSDLNAHSLAGYGTVEDAAGVEITALAADLLGLVRRGADLLKEESTGGLVAQITAMSGPVGTILRAILKVSTDQGLAEIRPLLAAAVERAQSTTLDVGVFGRTSSGKSSLINAIVGSPVLPVGATPVTAVPIRIRRGDLAVEVRFRDGRTLATTLAELPSYATEELNPQNKRDVLSIEVACPTAPEGLRLLDTPGVGSLAASGAMQAFAWLPRCDFGLVLVSAGTPLGRDETALVSGLRHAGIDCRVLISKADLLDGDDTRKATAYVQAELGPLLGREHAVEVLPISTRAGHTEGLDRLGTEVLESLAADHVRRAQAALRRRLRRLIEVTGAAMDGRGQSGEGGRIELEKRRASAREVIDREASRLAGSVDAVLETAAAAVASAWIRGEDGAGAARTAIQTAAARGLAVVRQEVQAARRDEADRSGARLPPLFDPEFLDTLTALPPRFLPGVFRTSFARRALEPLHAQLRQDLTRYAENLRSWGEGALLEIQPGDDAPSESAPRNEELAPLAALLDKPDDEAEKR